MGSLWKDAYTSHWPTVSSPSASWTSQEQGQVSLGSAPLTDWATAVHPGSNQQNFCLCHRLRGFWNNFIAIFLHWTWKILLLNSYSFAWNFCSILWLCQSSGSVDPSITIITWEFIRHEESCPFPTYWVRICLSTRFLCTFKFEKFEKHHSTYVYFSITFGWGFHPYLLWS